MDDHDIDFDLALPQFQFDKCLVNPLRVRDLVTLACTLD